MSVPVREYTTAAEMRAAYAQGRRKLYAVPRPFPKLPEPEKPKVGDPASWVVATRDENPRYVPAFKALSIGDVTAGPSIRSIIVAVGAFYGIRPEIIISRTKGKKEAFVRNVAMYMIKIVTDWSFPMIGRRLERDHTTILHACRNMGELARVDIGFAHDLFDILMMIRSPLAHGGVAYGGHRAPAVVGPSAGAPGGAT